MADKNVSMDTMVHTLGGSASREEKRRFLKEDLIRRHREAGVSMFGSHRAYPGERIEMTPDGRWFILGSYSVRLYEVEPQP